MKDEGPFILEFVAHHLVVGFDRIAIASNACRDGSERLLDALHAGGAIVHVHNEVPEGEAPQHAGYRQLRGAAGIDDFDWAMALDADEFLNVHAGDHGVQALIAAAPEAADIIALNGMTFGDGGRDAWAPGRVCAQFTRRLRPRHRANASVKSLTRGPARFKAFHNHSMVGFRGDAPLRVMWADGRIEELPPRAKLWQHLRRVAPEEIRHDLAQYNQLRRQDLGQFPAAPQPGQRGQARRRHRPLGPRLFRHARKGRDRGYHHPVPRPCGRGGTGRPARAARRGRSRGRGACPLPRAFAGRLARGRLGKGGDLPLARTRRFAYTRRSTKGRCPMTGELSPIDKAKFVAAKRAADFVEDGMRVGLGTGSTAAWLVRCLGEAVREDGLRIKGVPTSTRTAELAREVGIDVISLDEARWLDLTIDGADEFDGDLSLIKGGGGALLQEKIVATASDQMVVIADVGKEVETLGAFPLPIEVIPFGWQTTKALVEETLISMDVLGRDVSLRMNGDRPYITDGGNHILDLHLRRIGNPRQLAMVLNQMPGVVENGLFIDICDKVVVGYGDGRVEVRDINAGTIEEERLDFVEEENLFKDLGD